MIQSSVKIYFNKDHTHIAKVRFIGTGAPVSNGEPTLNPSFLLAALSSKENSIDVIFECFVHSKTILKADLQSVARTRQQYDLL